MTQSFLSTRRSGDAGMLLVGFSGLGVIVGGEPSINSRRRLSRHFDLAQRDAQRDAAEPAARWRKRGRVPSGGHGFKDSAFDVEQFLIAEAGENFLERRVEVASERLAIPEAVSRRMGRVKMTARNPSGRNELGGRMGSSVLQQSWKDMGVGPLRALSICRWN
jgi:hypothetical protein